MSYQSEIDRNVNHARNTFDNESNDKLVLHLKHRDTACGFARTQILP